MTQSDTSPIDNWLASLKPMGDIMCMDANVLLHSLAIESVACIVADPPYGIAYHSNYYKDGNPHHPIANDWNFQIGAFFRAVERVLRHGGALYLFTRFDVLPLWTMEIPPSLSLKNVIIWAKDNWSSGDLTGSFGFQYEMIMFIVKGRHHLRGKRWPNIWSFPRIPAKKLRMAAEKPVGLYERAIESSSDPDDLIVDPFCGSGTAAEAASRLGRRFLLSDIDKRMVNIAKARIGLPVAIDSSQDISMPLCPIVQMVPPSPALWGLHPEDFADWKAILR